MPRIHKPAGPGGGQFAPGIRLESGLVLPSTGPGAHSPSRLKALTEGIADRQHKQARLQAEMDALNLDAAVTWTLRDFPEAAVLRLEPETGRHGNRTGRIVPAGVQDRDGNELTSGSSWKFKRGDGELPLASHVDALSQGYLNAAGDGITIDSATGTVSVDLSRTYFTGRLKGQ